MHQSTHVGYMKRFICTCFFRASVDSVVEVCLSCTTCDGTEESLEFQENPYKMYINTLVKRYMNLREHMTPRVRQLFVLSLRQLANHLEVRHSESVTTNCFRFFTLILFLILIFGYQFIVYSNWAGISEVEKLTKASSRGLTVLQL